ncbi:MAG: ABC transporter ATP-binding protein [Alphaproteobacteria bacterium]|nr:ABC transporter ATP-binding protein [Alphaproteobacteria bacterium]MCB9928804.1 ABC transporter ATP-binding protein [Alphaproteobacteria bacterium]
MSELLLEIEGVETYYGNIQALHGIDLTVTRGEIVTLIGANGAGKSTLLMTICGNPQARHGTIRFEGEDITHQPTFTIVRRGVAHAPEGRRIFPKMTVLENLQLGAITAPEAHYARNLDAAFTLFPRLAERRSQRGGTLSGGEQQMLAIARALMSEPKLLLLDEPSLGLAPIIVRQIFNAIRTVNRETGMTVFLVEQNAYHALRLAHRGYVMVNGIITLSGTGQDLLANEEVRAAYLEGGH